MYVHDRPLSGLHNRNEERPLILRPSQRTSLYVPRGSSVSEFHHSFGNVSQPVTLTMRPRPFVTLDSFAFAKHLLSRGNRGKIKTLASHIVNSWRTSQPIRTIRLIGHTDEVGGDDYNVTLGMRRAVAVKAALEDDIEKLSPGLVKGSSKRVSIVTDSRGEKEPVARNGAERARNRRVEVFLSTVASTPLPPPPPPSPPPPAPIDFWRLGPETIKRLEEEGRREAERRRLTQPGPMQPGPPGRSISEWLDERLRKIRSKWLRGKIRDAILTGGCALLESLLSQATGQLSDGEKKDFRKICLDRAKQRSR
jgi:hypothetical protein